MLLKGKNTVIYVAGGDVGGTIARTCLVAGESSRPIAATQALEGSTEEWLTTR